LVRHIIVAITGASGVIYGKRLLQALKEDANVITHLVISECALSVIRLELGKATVLQALADFVCGIKDWSASIASGSSPADSMVIVPCSMKTLSGIAHGYSENVILRAADVTIKEKRKLILVVRETPLSSIHLRNMLELSNLGVIILPAMPGFYTKPESLSDLVNHIVGKILDLLGINNSLFRRWNYDQKSNCLD